MNNMRPSMESKSRPFDRLCSAQSHFGFPSPPPEINELACSADTHCWSSHTDPCGILHTFDASGNPRKGNSLSTCIRQASGPKRNDLEGIYLSPPPTESKATICVPLPEEAAANPSILTILAAGGILDSPRVMRNASHPHTLPSPPPTIPTTTHALPDSKTRHSDDSDTGPLSSPQEVTVGNSSSLESSTVPSHPDDEVTIEVAIGQYGARGDLLSPLSPEWSTFISNLTLTDRQSESPSLTFQKGYRDPPYDDNQAQQPSYEDSSPDFRTRESFYAGANCFPSPESPAGTVEKQPLDAGMSMGSPNSSTPESEHDVDDMLFFPTPEMHAEDTIPWHSGLPPEHHHDWSTGEHDHDSFSHSNSPPDTQSRNVSVSPSPDRGSQPCDRFSMSSLAIPYTSDTLPAHADTASSLTHLHSNWHDDGFFNKTHIDHKDSLPPLSPPCPDLLSSIDSPFGLHFPDECGLRTPEDFKSLPLSSAPFSPSSPFDDMNVPLASPSPSRRSFSALPELEDSDSDIFLPHQSPASPPLLSLPGGDTDDDLLPAFSEDDFPSPESYPLTPSTRSMGLLFIDDPNDVPAPRSPSPDEFDIDLDIDETIHPEFEQLCELRKKALAAERAARQLETQHLEQGDISSRAEVRRYRKDEKERSKEIGALLRLKLGNEKAAILEAEGEAGEEERKKKPKKMATSLPRLVAKMVFRRHDTNRPLRNRKLPGSTTEYPTYVRSPLSMFVSDYNSIGEEEVVE